MQKSLRTLHRLLLWIAPRSAVAALMFGYVAHGMANDLAMPLNTPPLRLPVDAVAEAIDAPMLVLGMEEVDIWNRIRKGFAIPDLDNPLVVSQTNWYASRPDYIQRTTLRASRYLFHVTEELEKRNMPTELALLPFIESAFEPAAVSSAKAVGMWQFMPATGADFNLRQSTFKDDRRDVLASTEAALNYLQRLYGLFGDWQLALAAYNWGEGSVQRAINKNRAAGLGIDFNSLSPLMPLETRNYYPKLQAVKNILSTPELYGITLPKVDNTPYFVTIGKTRDIDIKIAAQLAELSLDEFKALNPQFSRPVITGSNANTQILLPQSNAEKFKTNLANFGRTLSSWTSHTVTAARERIDTIAAKFGTTPQVIREVNNIPPNMRLRVGSTILVPKVAHAPEKDIASELVERAHMAIEPDVPDFRRIVVRVGKKDTLASIAAANRVSVVQIKTWNKLRQDRLTAGQSLQLQVPFKVTTPYRRPAGATNQQANRVPQRSASPARVAPSKPKIAVKAPIASKNLATARSQKG